MKVIHKELASGGWFKLTLAEQLANIGSEVHRTIIWRNKDETRFNSAFERALELFDLSLSDKRWQGRYKEICRSREFFCSLIVESEKYENPEKELNFLDNYFMQFAVLVNNKK